GDRLFTQPFLLQSSYGFAGQFVADNHFFLATFMMLVKYPRLAIPANLAQQTGIDSGQRIC
ncbi:MAG: hypothetical protein QF675_10350, partial [SAR324 cluster bacterium]|nr:hypothetical protein [SAR324 cluster bacterium]